MYIKEYLGIDSHEQVEFFNYKIGPDTYGFIEIAKLGCLSGKVAGECYEHIESFLNELIKNKDDKTKFDELLPVSKETACLSLGYSKKSVDGTGVGPLLNDSLKKAIYNLCKNAESENLKDDVYHLHLFVKNLSNDRMTDLIGKVILEVLSDYTKEISVKYNAISKCIKDKEICWDVQKKEWALKEITYIKRHNTKYILYPDNFVSSKVFCSWNRFFEMYILDFYKNAKILKDGKLKNIEKNDKKQSKKALRKFIKTMYRNKSDCVNFTNQYKDIYKKFIDDEKLFYIKKKDRK